MQSSVFGSFKETYIKIMSGKFDCISRNIYIVVTEGSLSGPSDLMLFWSYIPLGFYFPLDFGFWIIYETILKVAIY